VALTTGALAISLVIFQTLRALIKEFHLRRKGFAQVQPDEERGADGFVIQKRPSAIAEKAVVSPEKKECLLDQPPKLSPDDEWKPGEKVISLDVSPGQKWRASLKKSAEDGVLASKDGQDPEGPGQKWRASLKESPEQVVLASRDGQDPQGSSTSPIPELVSKPARERSPPPTKLDTRPARDRSPEPSNQPHTNVRWSITRDEPVLPTPREEPVSQTRQPPPKKDSAPEKPPPPTTDSGQQTEFVNLGSEAVCYILAKDVEPATIATPVGSRPPSARSQQFAVPCVESKAPQSMSDNKPASESKTVLPVVQTPPLMDTKHQKPKPSEIVKHEPSVSSAAQPPTALSAVPHRKLPPADLPFGMTYNATFTVEDQALGFELQFVGGCPVVTKVVDRSPAFVKGVSVQNRAVAVNGVPLRASWSVKKMSKQQWLASVFASRPLTITFEQTRSSAVGVPMSANQVSPPSLQLAYGNFKGDELC